VTFTNCKANGANATLSSDISFPLAADTGTVEDSIPIALRNTVDYQ